MLRRVGSLSFRQLWAWAHLVFWGATVGAAVVDWGGERLLGHAWPSGPDLFPNATLGPPVALAQVAALALLLVAAVRLRPGDRTVRAWAVRGAFVAVNASLALVVFALGAYVYLTEIMGRTL